MRHEGVFRDGEGFTPYELAILDEFVAGEVAIRSLYQRITAGLRPVDVYYSYSEGQGDDPGSEAWVSRDLSRSYKPIEITGSRGQSQQLYLEDTTGGYLHTSGDVATLTTEWINVVRLVSGTRTVLRRRSPTLIDCRFARPDLNLFTGFPRVDERRRRWALLNRADVRPVNDEFTYRETRAKQYRVIDALQRAHAIVSQEPVGQPGQPRPSRSRKPRDTGARRAN